MSDDEAAEAAAAMRSIPDAPRRGLWVVVETGIEVDEARARLVIARTDVEARRLAAALYDNEDAGDAAWWRATRADSPSVDPPRGVLGVWLASDYVWAACGIEPNDDWRHCGCCGEVLLVEERWTNDGDDCDDCTEMVDDDDAPPDGGAK